jgi:protein kinase A
MPTLGGFLKKKKTKESDPNSPQQSSTVNSTSSDGLKAVPTNSSQTSGSLHQNESASQAQSFTNSSSQNDAVAEQQSQVTDSSEGAISQVEGSSNPATMDGRTHHHQQHPTPSATPQVRVTKGKYTLTDFTIQRTLGTGSFGRVHLVQSKHNSRFYAIKVLKKAQVVKMKQVEHTNDERRMLQRVKHPFLITLWGTFQDSKNLYMVMDFIEGGELFSLLRKSQVRYIQSQLFVGPLGKVHVLTVYLEISKSGSKVLCS